MDVMTIIFFVVGVAALVLGAESLVRGASRLATRTGLSPIVVGLTVVAFGTSAPELAVSVGAAWRDEADLAIGNVVGSNIANVLLVLGISAIVGGRLMVDRRIVRTDVPIMLGVSFLLLMFGLDHNLNRIEGIIFVILLIAYLWRTVTVTRKNGELNGEIAEVVEELDADHLASSSLPKEIGYVLAGLVLLVVGSSSLVEAATDIALALGVSELVIGLTVVAIGTSLPEVATSVVAAARGERELAIGNAVGSNLFNILAVLGITATISPSALPIPDSAVSLDIPIMLAVAFACLPIFANGFNLKRWEGIVFLGFYVSYLAWLVLDASNHDARDSYAVAMLGFVVPLVVLTMAVLAVWERRRPRA